MIRLYTLLNMRCAIQLGRERIAARASVTFSSVAPELSAVLSSTVVVHPALERPSGRAGSGDQPERPREKVAARQDDDHPRRRCHEEQRVEEPRQRSDGMVKRAYAAVGMLARQANQ